jgi:hypothetical protein
VERQRNREAQGKKSLHHYPLKVNRDGEDRQRSRCSE